MNRRVSKCLICLLLVTVIICGTGVSASSQNEAVRELIPLGMTVGVEVQTGGLLITALTTVDCDKGSFCPARQAGLASGDLITAINQTQTPDMETFAKQLALSGGKSVTLTVSRSGVPFYADIVPVSDSDGVLHIGVMAKDTIEGIGTMTYYDPQEKIFAALGHGISEAGVLLPIWKGQISKMSVMSTVKGKSGAPGHLEGSYNLKAQLGQITANTVCGIFGGALSDSVIQNGTPIPVAHASQIVLGAATIYANVSNEEVRQFSVEIVSLNSMAKDGLKDLEIRVTDPELLMSTGGIVQGMSGSPIIQNGRLIGAVTHVLVKDPTRGYGISIEKMLEAGRSTLNQAA